MADFFLHGNKADPRISQCYQLYKKYFDKANALLSIPGKRATVQADGFEVDPGMIEWMCAISCQSIGGLRRYIVYMHGPRIQGPQDPSLVMFKIDLWCF